MKTFLLSSYTRPLLVLATAALMAGGAAAQGAKIGAVNVDRILRDSAVAKAVSAKLEQDFSKREKELQAQAAQIKAASEKFEREAPTLPESQRIARQRQLIEQDRDLQRKQREFQEDLALRKSEGLQQVLEKVNRALKQVAEAEKYDLIVQEAAYINPRLDITDKVLEVLNNTK
jgi:outer membrane protein